MPGNHSLSQIAEDLMYLGAVARIPWSEQIYSAVVMQCCSAAVGKGKEVGGGRQNFKYQMTKRAERRPRLRLRLRLRLMRNDK